MELNDFYNEMFKNKIIHDNLIFNFKALTHKYKTKPIIKLTVNDDFELQLLLPNSFHKKHGTELANVLKYVYHDTIFYKTYKISEDFQYPFYERMYYDKTKCYIMWEFDRDIYGYTKNLLSVSYHVLSHGLFLFLNPEINYLKKDKLS